MATRSGFQATRKPVDGYLDYEGRRAHGLYSSKIKVPKATGVDNKPTPMNCTIAPWMDPASRKLIREAYKGKQIQVKYPKSKEYFRKLEYAPEPYDDVLKNGGAKKMGFGTGKPLSRDDLSSVLQVARYRHHLEVERKQEAGITEAIMAEATRLREATNTRRVQTAPSVGLSTRLPQFTSHFDRANFVPEFTTKDPRKLSQLKPDFNLGPLRPSSADYGDGAYNRENLHTPSFGIQQGVEKIFGSRYARPTVHTIMPTGL